MMFISVFNKFKNLKKLSGDGDTQLVWSLILFYFIPRNFLSRLLKDLA